MLNSPNPLTKAVHVNGAVIYDSLYSRLLSQGTEFVIDHALNVLIERVSGVVAYWVWNSI